MAQPFNYSIQAPSPFESLLGGLKLGMTMEELQMRRDQMRAQTEQAQEKAKEEQQRQMRMQEVRQKIGDGTASPADWLQYGQDSNSEAMRKAIGEQMGRMDAEKVRNAVGMISKTATALSLNSEVGMTMLKELRAANPESKQLEAIEGVARQDPVLASRLLAAGLPAYGADGAKAMEAWVKATMPADPAAAREALAKAEKAEQDALIARANATTQGERNAAEIALKKAQAEKARAEAEGRGTPSQLQKAQAYRQTLQQQGAQNSPEYAENEQYIKNLLVDPTKLTDAQIRANELQERRLALLEEQSDPGFQERQAAARARGQATGAAEVQRAVSAEEVGTVISELERALEKGGLIDRSTGSSVGALRDVALGTIGQATPGAIAIGQLQPIADLVLKIIPRFEGPQSDKDTASYREAAGKLADPTVPNEIRRAAANEIVRVLKDRKGRLGSTAVISPQSAASPAASGAAASRGPAATAAPGFPAPPQAAIDALKAGRGTPAQFDQIFGPGAAARVMGR